MPYQGSKWRHRRALDELVRERGFIGVPSRIELSDPGPWGTAVGHILRSRKRAAVLALLQEMVKRDPRDVFDVLHGGEVPQDGSVFTAEFLFLQRLAYSGKAVGVRSGRWSSPGFNTSSAYGLEATERFGAVKPMIPSLIRTLSSYDELHRVRNVQCLRSEARRPDRALRTPTLVYIDPPYQGSTTYPNGHLSREEVRNYAKAWFDAGAVVLVSESEPLPRLIEQGWTAHSLARGRNDTSPFRGQQEEWVTMSPPRR